MTTTVYNADGSVYMHFPNPAPSPGDLEGWTVRQVSSGTHGPACSHSARLSGTHSITVSDVESFNGLLKLIGDLSSEYGYRARSSRVGADSFRWTFEREFPGGHRASDMVIASKIH